MPFTFGENLTSAVSAAIKEIEAIEEEASSEIEIRKKKEERWREKVITHLQPFKEVANLWIAAASGLKLNESEYHRLASGFVSPPKPRTKESQLYNTTWLKFKDECESIIKKLTPFHWELEFPDVFFNEDGSRKENAGFDAVLGNPPYISTQTSSDFEYRNALERRFGFVDDLYMHFVFQGFNLLRIGGMFGYIVSDTFFTISTKKPMRELLQRNRLIYLGQCDPFSATVDAAIFVASRTDTKEGHSIDFIQARYGNATSKPEKEIEKLFGKNPPLPASGPTGVKIRAGSVPVFHAQQSCLRLHKATIEIYREAVRQVFFEPTNTNIQLYNRFNSTLSALIEKWWPKIETSSKFDKHRQTILTYQATLNPGGITLVGLVAEGAQGLGTGNNGKYLGYIENSDSANKARLRRQELLDNWKSTPRFSSVLVELNEKHNSDFDSIAEEMKQRFANKKESWIGESVGFKRGEVYRIVPVDSTHAISNLTEDQRSAIVYQGLRARKCWLPYSKGDKEGNRWTTERDLYIRWSGESVSELQTLSTARWQGHKYFLQGGVSWSDTGNHVGLKARIAPVAVFDVSGMRLSPMIPSVSSLALLAIMNSNLFSFFIKKFIDHTQKYQINDIRQAPLVIPDKNQAAELDYLAGRAIEAKEMTLRKEDPSLELIEYCRQLAYKQQQAPDYLRPRPQLLLLDSAKDCLDAIELAVQWEVEKLYGVEGQGPFDEF